MVEVLVSIVLLSVGVVASVSTLGNMTKSEALMQEGERMRRLADLKLQELIATGDYVFTTTGDFTDLGENRYQFTAEIEPTGVENLEVLTVTITRTDRREDEGYDASQVLFIPPATTDGDTP